MDQTSPTADAPNTPPPMAAAAWRRPNVAGRSAVAVTRFLLVVIVILAADLGLKAWSFANVAGRQVVLTQEVTQDHRAFWSKYPHDATVAIPGVLELRLTTNTGAVFGLGKGNRVMFILVSVVATAVISILFCRSPARAWGTHLALGMILAGALGNLYDRVVYRAVRDMLHLLPGVDLPFGLTWPGGAGGGVSEVWPWIFNPADVALMVGVGLILITTWRTDAAVRAGAKRVKAEKAKQP